MTAPAQVNRALRKAGFSDVTIFRGNGYYYFDDKTTSIPSLYDASRFYEDNKFLRDEESVGLFGEWQILYDVRRSLTPKPRRYRKGGLNLCRS